MVTVNDMAVRLIREENKIFNLFQDGVQSIMAPFKPGVTYVLLDGNALEGRTLHIHNEHLPVCDVSVDLVGTAPEDVVMHILGEFKKHYAKNYVEPESHIILGLE